MSNFALNMQHCWCGIYI